MLNFRQQIFVNVYTGNGTEAATLAGYANPGMEANRLLNNPKIIAALDTRDHNKHKKNIASREERQVFWTNAMRNTLNTMSDRLKAAECLGRSEADFVDRLKLEVGMGEQLAKLSDDEIRQKIQLLEDSGVIEMIQNKNKSFEPVH